MSDWPFGGIPMFSAGLIMSDCPWSFENWSEAGEEKNAKAHYECMPTEEIARLPVGQLAGRDCWLFQWATHPMLKDAIYVTERWGFKVVTSGVWVKRGKGKDGKPGKLAFGSGYVLRCASEPFIIAKVGNPPICSHSVRTVIEAPRGRHSEKPTEAYEACEALAGDVPLVSIFDRKSRPRWTMWGRQAGLFDTNERVSTRQIRAEEKKRAAAERQGQDIQMPLLDLIGSPI
jgi:N6-adenosine-specific RNA methylase IME4